MPYTSIPTKTDGEILTAAHLNILSANQEFLWALANAVNTPFASHRSIQATLDRMEAAWVFIHKHQWLHYNVKSYGGNWNYARIYYRGFKVAGSESSTTTLSGSVDLTNPATWPNYAGAWQTSTSYDDDVNGDGDGGNGDDGHVVSHGGAFYRCKSAHTSGSSTEPGIGANWATVWDLINPPDVGAFYEVYADVNFSSGTEVGVEYLLQADSNTL